MLSNTTQICKEFHKLGIEDIAKSTGFIKRPSKLTGMVFVLSYLIAFSQNSRASLAQWSSIISEYIGKPYSPQALSFKSELNCLAFCKSLFAKVLQNYCLPQSEKQHYPKWAKMFTSIILEDSTTLGLSKRLEKAYPGGANQNTSSATLRLQFRLCLLELSITNMSLSSYRQNDQSFAGDIVKSIKKGMLVLRDMGYLTVDALQGIIAAEGYFITRWNTQMNIYTQQGIRIDFNELIKKRNINIIDIPIELGSKLHVQMRLVANRLPDKVKAERVRRQREKDKKSQSRSRSPKYYELLGWSFYLTNIDNEAMSGKEIEAIYSLRWRVENFFKMLKSHLNIDEMFTNKEFLSPHQIELRVYLTAIYLAGVLMPSYNWCNTKTYEDKSRYVSLEKFAQSFRTEFCKILYKPMNEFIDKVLRYCLYDKRRSALNFMEILYQNNISKHHARMPLMNLT